MKMKNRLKSMLACLAIGASFSTPVFAGMEDDPIITKLALDKFEVGRSNGKDILKWEGGFWVGKDINKFVFKTAGERVGSETEGTESQFLFNRAIDPFWSFEAGLRRDTAGNESRNYGVLGFQGVAPFFVGTDASLSFGKNDQVKLNVGLEYEMMLTQRLVLIPEVEFNAYAKDDAAMGIGTGLSNIEASIRLGYEVKREFMPYIGFNWGKKFGKTADLAIAGGGEASESMVVMGISAWY